MLISVGLHMNECPSAQDIGDVGEIRVDVALQVPERNVTFDSSRP